MEEEDEFSLKDLLGEDPERRLCLNKRTLENWEQGRVKPNAHAAILMLLVHHFPDTLERLRRIARPDPVRRRRKSSAASS